MNGNQLAKYILGAAVLGAIFAIFAFLIVNAVQENNLVSALVGGSLIPWGTLVLQFFFRKSGPGEGESVATDASSDPDTKAK